MTKNLGRSPGARAKNLVKEASLPLVAAWHRLGDGRGRTLLILAHMRSGSTLLQHLLVSHPAFAGRGERNRPYASEKDLDRLVADVCFYDRRLPRRGMTYVDQVNHGPFIADPALLDHPRVRALFLIREPIAAVASMVAVLGRHYDFDLESAVGYYTERLAELSVQARRIRRPEAKLFLTYEDLVEAPAATLASLSELLALTEPLDASYRRFRFTGRRGDPSPRIHEGKIRARSTPRSLDLSADQRHALEQAFESCRRELESTCRRAAKAP